jgi:hypothetical protein
VDPDPGRPKMVLREKKAVLWISIGFNADPDPVFYLRIQEETQCGSRRIWILIRLLSHKKLKFYIKIILEVGKKTYL